ncbi:MAG TPA: hypothetical protein VIH42_09885 [Thermoguttaceae bacterium]
MNWLFRPAGGHRRKALVGGRWRFMVVHACLFCLTLQVIPARQGGIRGPQSTTNLALPGGVVYTDRLSAIGIQQLAISDVPFRLSCLGNL